jgi:hypothetical protein
MFTRLQRGTLLLLAILCAPAIAVLAASERQAVAQPALAEARLRFNAREAMAHTRELAQHFPDRVTGSAASRRAARFLADRFASLGYHAEIRSFWTRLHGRRVTGENVVAYSGKAFESARVLLLAHYDCATTTHQAAEDDASGVGTLLALANALRGRQGVAFAATDAQEWGMIGARRLAVQFARKPLAGISIDGVNAGKARGLQFTFSGQISGYTPLWLRMLGIAAAHRESGVVDYPYGAFEWIDRAIELSFQDQGPLLDAGIPALNVMTLPGDVEGARVRYHSPADVFANFDPASFAMAGRASERMTLAVLAMPASGLGDMFLLRQAQDDTVAAQDDTVVAQDDTSVVAMPVWALRVMMYIALLPLVAAWFMLIGRAGGGVFVMLLPPVAALVALYALTAAGILPRYEFDPATLKDPFLYHPPLLAAGTLAAILLAGYGLIAALGFPKHTPGKRDLILWLVPLCVGAAAINPFGMWLYLGVFGYASLLFSTSRSAPALLLNALLLIAAALPFAVILLMFARETHLGAYILWYLVLQTAYGVWPPWIALAGIVAILLWVQFARLALGKFFMRRPRLVVIRHRPA